MTTDNRIPCPSFDVVIATLLEVVAESPQQTSRHAYLDSAGYPHDLVGHVLARLDAPINTAAAGHMRHHDDRAHARGELGTPRALVRFPLLWNRLFTEGAGPNTPYDGPLVMFPNTPRGREDYLVYALLGHIVDPQGRGRFDLLDWRGDAIRGLKSFRRFLLSPSSGFLVQTHGLFTDLLESADDLSAKALAALTSK